MSGQDDGAGSKRRAREGRGPRRRRTWLPDRIAVACPPGTRDRIEEAAAADGLTPAEWMRAAFRTALEAARKRRDRAARCCCTAR